LKAEKKLPNLGARAGRRGEKGAIRGASQPHNARRPKKEIKRGRRRKVTQAITEKTQTQSLSGIHLAKR